MITSARNPKVQHIRNLQQKSKNRRESGSFVVEGARLAEEALMSGWQIRSAFFTESLASSDPNLARALEARGVAELVSEEVMRSASDTQTPQGVLVEVEQRGLDLPAQLTFALILDGVSDPGNVGTLLRSAAAANCDAVLLGPGCADAFSPKVLRSGMGAHFRQPMLHMDWASIAKTIANHKLALFAAEAWEGAAYDEVDFTVPLALILGGEAAGSSEQATQLNPQPIQIPMPGRTESLNVATAGSILLFEVVRQRRHAAR
jgi:TrmH family RNA methyltransferase